MKKLFIAILAASGAAVAYAQAETADRQARGGELRAEMRALIAGDGLGLDDLTRLMEERSQARFNALDTDEDGVVSLEEFLAATDARSQARFERMGPNEDGIVTGDGRRGWGRHHRNAPRAEGQRQRPAVTAERRAERLSERAAEQFARLDTDGDGAISPEEFEAGLQARGERFAERRQERAERREQRSERRNEIPDEVRETRAQFRMLMRDGVNLESFSEFMRERAAARFAALDADGNGDLTVEEFTANIADHAQRLFARMDTNDDGIVTPADRWRGGQRK